MTHEIRIDPLSGSRTIIASGRATRPGDVKNDIEEQSIDVDRDPFARGNEVKTPPERFALRSQAGQTEWQTRVFENLYPTLKTDASTPEPSGRPELFQAQAAKGAHEVIVNCSRPVTQLSKLTEAELDAAVSTWQARLQTYQEAAYAHLIVNEGNAAGASLPHTHAQLFALPFVPTEIARERERFSAYAAQTMGGNLLQDLIQEEVRQGDRIVGVDKDAVLFAPYAARLPYELTLAPRRPQPHFAQEAEGITTPLLHTALQLLKQHFGASPPLNLWIRTAPQGADHYCWRIVIVPRLTHLAGLELGTGLQVNIVAPETAAAQLRSIMEQ